MLQFTKFCDGNLLDVVLVSREFADLPSEVILMREISAGVPINDPIAPAVIPIENCKHCL